MSKTHQALDGGAQASVLGEDDYWDALSKGGAVTMPMDKAPWGDTFGMLTDKFGVNWMVNITGAQGAE